MKSFMRNQRMPQTQAIRADARFDALVKKEMQEHQHLISSHNKEMQALREEVRLCLQKCESLSDRNEKELSELKDRSENHIQILKEKIESHKIIIAEQKKCIDSLHERLNGFHENYASKLVLEKSKKEIEAKVSEATMSHLISFQDCQRACKELFTSLNEKIEKIQSDIRDTVFKTMEHWEEKFLQAKLDKEGIERELIRYKKSMFYIEKKIENIYTLIERINKRGSTCPKQE